MTGSGTVLAIPATLHAKLKTHLFPGDGLEAAAVLICSRHQGHRERFIVRDVVLAPHEKCRRQVDAVSWPGAVLEAAVDLAEDGDFSLIAIHAHPGGLWNFSLIDDASDAEVIPGLHAAIGESHGTAIMIPSGAIHARIYPLGGGCHDVDLVTTAGHDIHFWWSNQRGCGARPMAFSSEMTSELARLSAFVIGASGTGSPTIEQVGRLGFGAVGMADFDKVEPKNLNRILNTSAADAEAGALKVAVLQAALKRHRPSAKIIAEPRSIAERGAILAAAEADILFCCTDSHASRNVCDKIAAAFCIPLIDMGVTILTSNEGAEITDVVGRIDYVQPGGSTLADREVYTPASLAAEDLARTDPDYHTRQVREGYIKGRHEEAPAVISLNLRVSAAAVMEFIARAYPFRHDPNRLYARTMFSLAAMEEDYSSEETFPRKSNRLLGRAGKEPLLNMLSLKQERRQ